MTQSLFEQQQQSWSRFFHDRYKLLHDLEQRSWQLVSGETSVGGKLPEHYLSIIREERKSWLKVWGINGLHYSHLYEETNLLMKDVSSADRDTFLKSILLPEQWPQAHSEQMLVHHTYQQSGENVPTATRKRMIMQIDMLREGYNGIFPRIETENWKILSEDLASIEIQCWQELRDAQGMIIWLYQDIDHLPLTTQRRFAFEIEQFWREADSALAHINL